MIPPAKINRVPVGFEKANLDPINRQAVAGLIDVADRCGRTVSV
jgi:hypothetical protein